MLSEEQGISLILNCVTSTKPKIGKHLRMCLV